MIPIPFPLPAGRILPPTVAYAAGLTCEHRPDLADAVRAAVLGDDRAVAFNDLMIERAHFADEGGAEIVSHLSEIVHYGGFAAKDLHALAALLGAIPRRTPQMWIATPDHMERVGDPTIGDVWAVPTQAIVVCGRPAYPWQDNRATHEGAVLLMRYLREGFARVWAGAFTPGEREALRRLVPIHAHTVSLDPAIRAAWAKAHLDALTPPVRPQSPDRLN